MKNEQPDFSGSLDAITAIHTVRFNYKEDNPLGLDPEVEHVGVVAQELAEVLPEAVVRNRNDGFLRVRTEAVLWTMVNAVKELRKRLEERDAQVADLEKRLSALENRED